MAPLRSTSNTDSTLLVTGSADKNIKIWGLDFGDCHKSLFAHADSVMTVSFVPNTHYVFTGGGWQWNGCVNGLFEVLVCCERLKDLLHRKHLCHHCYAVSCSYGTFIMPSLPSTPSDTNFPPYTHIGKDGTIKYWDADKFEQLLVLEGHYGEVWCMAVSSFGEFVISGGWFGCARVRSVQGCRACVRSRSWRGCVLLLFNGHGGLVGAVRVLDGQSMC